jgi:preprotein translocase subunit SecE
MIEAIKNYFVGSYHEMKKVNWPSKKQTINYSVLVIGLSLGFAVLFSILDYIFSWGVSRLITK